MDCRIQPKSALTYNQRAALNIHKHVWECKIAAEEVKLMEEEVMWKLDIHPSTMLALRDERTFRIGATVRDL